MKRSLDPAGLVELSRGQARRLAIAAQGLGGGAAATASRRDIRRTIQRLGLLQIDSVNVLQRAHYMPVFSRHGAYDTEFIDSDAYRGKRRRLFEYWGREASLIPVEMHRLFRWRMADAEAGRGTYKHLTRLARENRPFIDRVLAEIADRGALAASAITEGNDRRTGWWGWSDGKLALEYLFWSGRITTLRRETAGFTRIYDLAERVLHADVLDAPTPDRASAQRALLLHAMSALGVATPMALRGYYRLPADDAKQRIAELVEAGDLRPARVEAWEQPVLVGRDVRVPRRVTATALLSPFDPLIAERGRTERLFDFHYRIEIYTPEAKRQYGYYCLPLLVDDSIVGRLDLKADRAAATLRVQTAHAEPGTDVGAVAERAAPELDRMARWLGLDRVAVARRGDLAKPLAEAVRRLAP